tara:strand:- start:1300 stop:2157 length:858 start_codon:yes stop_codon:yes gene_type:complete
MKRNEALAYVLDELKSIKKTILENKSVSPIRFLELSEIFKFKIEPSSDRFNAICLTEIAKKNTDKEYLKMIDEILDEEDVDEGDTEEEIDELVDFDGSIMSSKIPLGTTDNKTMSSKKTTDAVVGATRQSGTWSGAGHYFRRYWGESVEEVGESDKSSILGFEETDQLPFDSAVEYYEEDLEMDKEEALERVERERGPKSLEKEKAEGSFTRQRITEKERLKKLSEDRARDMIEVILSKNSTPGELTKEPTDIMDGKLKKVINYYKKDKDLSDLVGRVEDMWNNE